MMKLHTPARRLFAVVFLVMAVAGAPAQASRNLYSQVAPQVAYLRHELFIDGTKAKQTPLWKRMEEITKVPFLGAYLPIASGSGFFVDDQGRMVTNRHVVEVGSVEILRSVGTALVGRVLDGLDNRFTAAEKADLKADLEVLLDKASYRFSAMVGTRFLGTITVLAKAKDPEADLALVEVAGYSGPSLELAPGGPEGITVGDDVASFGYPLGDSLDAVFKERVVTMNRGAVSAYRASELLDLQHSAAISHGNSGGPLVDDRGRVVGVNTAGYDASVANSLYYAVSAKRIREFLKSRGYGDLLLWNQRLAQMSGDSEEKPVLIPVTFTSSPPGARVRADGRELGTAPVVLNLPPGEYRLVWDREATAFFPTDLDLTEGQPVQVLAQGKPGRAVQLSYSGPSPEARGTFRTAEGEYLFSGTQAVVPPGSYVVTVKGEPGLSGVEIPVTVSEETTNLDLVPFYRISDLTIRGFEVGASVFVDGKPWTGAGDGSLTVPVGLHTIAVWKDGRQPLMSTRITVREPGVAFVTWRRIEGFEVLRDRLLWGGLTLGGLGAVAGGAGWFAGQDSVAAPRAGSYSEYKAWKSAAGIVFWGGLTSVAVGAALEIWSLVADQQYQAQRKEFGR